MDRFIEKAEKQIVDDPVALKSNMDRFIVSQWLRDYFRKKSLKSNMDRFIEGAASESHSLAEI